MAKSFAVVVAISMLLAVAVQAHPGRKMQQLHQQTGGRATVAQADTAAKIEAAVDSKVQVKPSQNPMGSVMVASAKPAGTTKPPPPTVTAAIATTSKTMQGGAESAGTATAGQAATEARINAAASGVKPTTKPTTAAAAGPKPTTMIATTSKTGQGGALSAGTSTAGQSATAAMINQAAGGAKPPKP